MAMNQDGNSLPYTAEGLAAAAATREVLKEACKKRKAAPADSQTPGKKIARRPPTCTHDVERPEGFKDDSLSLDETIYGERGATNAPHSNVQSNARMCCAAAAAAAAAAAFTCTTAAWPPQRRPRNLRPRLAPA